MFLRWFPFLASLVFQGSANQITSFVKSGTLLGESSFTKNTLKHKICKFKIKQCLKNNIVTIKITSVNINQPDLYISVIYWRIHEFVTQNIYIYIYIFWNISETLAKMSAFGVTLLWETSMLGWVLFQATAFVIKTVTFACIFWNCPTSKIPQRGTISIYSCFKIMGTVWKKSVQ